MRISNIGLKLHRTKWLTRCFSTQTQAGEKLGFQDIVTLSKHRGFIYQGSEVYGGLKGTFDYGPLGVELKKNLMNAWWNKFIKERPDCYGLDSAIVLHPKVWEVAGHTDNFVDPLVECLKCHTRLRADKLVEDKGMTLSTNPTEVDKYITELQEKLQGIKLVCPGCKSTEFTPPRMFNLLMQTNCGAVPTYLRPETAQGIFLNFDRVRQSMNASRLPLGIGQVGKAFRNEISPRDFVFRMREFEQMELEYFCLPEESKMKHEEWVNVCVDFLKEIGIHSDNIRLKSYEKHELAHYALATTDIEYRFPFGWSELWGIANRGDFDMKRHNVGARAVYEHQLLAHVPGTGTPAPVKPKSEKDAVFPHVVEPSVGVDRLILALLSDAWHVKDVVPLPLSASTMTSTSTSTTSTEGGKSESTAAAAAAGADRRTVLSIHEDLAPIKFAVLPVTSKPDQSEAAHAIAAKLRRIANTTVDRAGSIGKRYRRFDEIGTPYCVTIDKDTLTEGTVTIRERDTMRQIRMSVDELVAKAQRHRATKEPTFVFP